MKISSFLLIAVIEILRLYNLVSSEPISESQFEFLRKNWYDFLRPILFGYEIHYSPNNENYVKFAQTKPNYYTSPNINAFQTVINGNYYQPTPNFDNSNENFLIENMRPAISDYHSNNYPPLNIDDYKNNINKNYEQRRQGNLKTIFIEDIIRPTQFQKMKSNRRNIVTTIDHLNFDYSENSTLGPSRWYTKYPVCGSTEQSPVNIDVGTLKRYTFQIRRPLYFVNYNIMPDDVILKNTGHSVELSFKYPENNKPYIQGGPFKYQYIFEQLHFHWGNSNYKGSEHTINSNTYAAEIHAVHLRSGYKSIDEALIDPNGLLVIAFMLELQDTVNNLALDIITDSLNTIITSNSEIAINPFPLSSLMNLNFTEDYAVYTGSLTTPPCVEITTWVIAPKALTISNTQLNKFRMLKTATKTRMSENNRPIQPLNRRKIYLVPSQFSNVL